MQSNLDNYKKINLKSTENFKLYGGALPSTLKSYIEGLLSTNMHSQSAILIISNSQYQNKKNLISTFEVQGFKQLVIVIDNDHLVIYNFGGEKITEYKVKDGRIMISIPEPGVKNGPLYEFALKDVAEMKDPFTKFENDLEDSLRGVNLDQFYNAILV